MKPKLLFLFLVLISFSLIGSPANIYKHQVLQSEADKLNELADALGVSGTGWPVSSEETDDYPSVSRIGFIHYETQFKEVNTEGDSIFIQKYKVQGIDFNNMGLSGTIPDISFDLLERLVLNGNPFSGEIPNLDLPKCKSLDLDYCGLSGEIPALNLPNLEYLNLGDNQFTGEIPDFNMPLLESLYLDNNNLSGELILFTGLPALKYLHVENNELTSINKYFGLPKLEFIELYGNQFSGELPSINCPMLKSLDLNNYNSYSNRLGYGFTGSIPADMNLPSCQTLKLNHNGLTGEIPELYLPSIKYLDIKYNKLTGGLSNIPDMMGLITLDVSYNEFSGQLPVFNMPDLISLNCARCNFTDQIPAINCPLLESLDLNGNELTGSIPNFNLPELEDLDLSSNNLTGSIPNFNLPKLETLDLVANELSGPIPNLNLPELRYFEANANNLSGPIPNLNLPSLTKLRLSNNNLEGPLPPFNLPDLDEMRLDNNNISGPIPSFSFPVVDEIYLNNNNLSDSIPVLNLPTLRYLILNDNDLTGNFNNTKLPNLYKLSLRNNDISGLLHIKEFSPNFTSSAEVRNNQLTFEDLEPNIDINYFYYDEQDSVEHFETPSGNQMILTIDVGGTANSYQWMKKAVNQEFADIPGATSDSVSVPFEPNVIYMCRITNSIANQLTLYSKKGIGPSCISIGVLEFCTEASEWEKGEEDNQMTTNGKVNINDLLSFEGNITIDTTQLTLKAEGEFYMSDIPLPGGSSIGKFSFCKGEYELKLAGEEGVITDFANSQLADVGELFGIGLEVTKLELVGGRNATGVKMDCKVSIPGITGPCGESEDDETKVELSGLSFTTTDGVSLEGVKITDLGMFIDGFCLKQLEISYDSEKDVLISGASVALPFGEIGGGFKLAQGYLDSVAWRIEASKPAFVIGTTTIGVKGCFGRISNITDNPLEVELGGIFSDITTENLYQLDISGMTKWPSVFGAKGSGKFFKPPFVDKPYQVNGEVSLEYDFSENIFKVEMTGKIGTNDEETWLIDGSGKLTVCHKTAPTKIAGDINGKMTLTELEKKFPYTWLNSMFSLPIEGEASTTLVWANNTHILNGHAKFQTETRGPYALRYVINLKKAYRDPDFLYWDTNIETKSAKLKSGNTTGEYKEEVVIPENTEFAVIGITSDTLPPVSTLTDPTGKIYEMSSEEDQVIYTISTDSTQAFWTVSQPISGVWNIVLTDPSEQDSVILFVQQPLPELNISMVQNGNNVTVTWDPTYLSASYEVSIMLDDDDSGFDGFEVASGIANTGQISFEMNDSLSACNYHLYARASNENSTIQDYADGTVSNPKAILAAPLILEANYNPNTGITTVYYENSEDYNANGYILEVVDNLGNDSIYSILNARGDSVRLVIENYENKAVRMTSFDLYGLQGCPSEAVGIHNTSARELFGSNKLSDELIFYPNPTSGKGTIKYRLENESYCDIVVTDFTGRIIAQPVSQVKPSGIHREEWDFGNMPNGMYLIILKTNNNLITAKCILSR
ncbi:MAG: leucine-rich repeat domain-containing protein [Prolixibacteraceae bacterium]|nr:leucine-rich repeat domain-containing protein [Prolixibacteraceae bacterium]